MSASSNSKSEAPQSWARWVVESAHCCPLCVCAVKLGISRLGKPYISCRRCMMRMFLNSKQAAQRLVESESRLIRRGDYALTLSQTCLDVQQFLDFIPGGEKQAWLARGSTEQAAERMEQVLMISIDHVRSELENAGKACTLCGLSAEWRKLKKGHYQACRFCVTTVFLHSPFALACLIERHRILR